MSTKLVAAIAAGAVAVVAGVTVAVAAGGGGSDDAPVAVDTGVGGIGPVDEEKDAPDQADGSDGSDGEASADTDGEPSDPTPPPTETTSAVPTTGTDSGLATATTTAGTGGGAGPDELDAVFGAGAVDPFVVGDDGFTRFPAFESDKLVAEPSVPTAGRWTVTNLEGQLDCGVYATAIPAGPPEHGDIEVLDGGRTLVGTGLEADAAGQSITVHAVPGIRGRYAGTFDATSEGVLVTIDYLLQVVHPERIVGYLSATFSDEGVTCEIYRGFELEHAG